MQAKHIARGAGILRRLNKAKIQIHLNAASDISQKLQGNNTA